MGKTLKPNQRKAAQLLVYGNENGATLTKQEIADKVGISRQTLHTWQYKDELFTEYINNNLMSSIKAAAPDALKQMIKLSQKANNENVRYSASKDILDRAGFKPVEKVHNTIDTEKKELIEALDKFASDLNET